MRKYLFAFSLVILYFPLFSQNLKGRVFNLHTKEPLSRVNINIEGTNQYLLFSDENGEFNLDEIIAGSYKLTVSRLGFENYSLDFNLITGQSLNLDIPLVEFSFNLPEVEIISASRKITNPLKLPFASSALIEPSQSENIPRTLPEALNIIPGVFVQKTNHGGGSPFIRGLTGNQTLILIDGIRMNNSTFRYGPNQYLNTIDPFSIEKIEVIRGSGSVQYGSDAIGGVIHAFSKNPKFSLNKKLIGNLNARYSTGKMEKTGSAELIYSTPRMVFSGIFGLKNFGNLIGGDTTGVQSPSGYTESNASLKFKVRLSPSTELILANQFLQQNDVDIFHKVKLENFKINKVAIQGRNLSYLKLKIDRPSPWFKEINFTSSLNHSIEQRNTLKNASFIAGMERDNIRTSSLAVEMLTDFTKKWAVTNGLEYYFDKIKSIRQTINTQSSESTNLRGLYPNNASYSNFSLFSLHHLNFGRFNVESGLRLNWLSASIYDKDLGQMKLSPSAFVWNTGINYTINKQSIYFSLNSGYRAPNIDDLGTLGIVDFRYELPSFSLKPEKNFNIELGYKYAYRNLGFGFSIYQNRLKDLISRVQTNQLIENYKVYIKENTEKAVIKGIEGFFHWKINRNFTFDTFSSLNHGENISKSEPLRRVPPLNVNMALKYKLSKFYIKGELAWADKQSRLAQGDKEDNRIPINGTPGWNILNVYSGYSFRKFDLRASLQNIYNIDYRTHGSGINGVGRSVWLNIQYKLGGINI